VQVIQKKQAFFIAYAPPILFKDSASRPFVKSRLFLLPMRRLSYLKMAQAAFSFAAYAA
jgi:hypothetical protein